MEPRIEMGVVRMGSFTPVDPKGKTDRQLLISTLKQTEQVHACLEQHISETQDHRQRFGRAIGDLTGRMDIVEGTVKRLGTMWGARVPDDDDDDPPPKPKVGMSWKTHLVLAGTIFGALSGVGLAYQWLWPALVALHHAILGTPQ